jgi:hypothetical protein
MALTGFNGNGLAETNHHKYLVLHKKCEKVIGDEACGRNIVQQGLANGATSGRKYQRRVKRSILTIRRWLSPPPVAAPQSSTPTAPAEASGGGGCSGMSAESGSTGYNNTSHPGYIGCYQISQDHYSNTGSCRGLGTDPAGQDQCAAIICRTEGAGAWTNPAGQNPCGRLGG